MQANGERFGHRGFAGSQAFGNRVALARACHQKFAERSLDVGKAHRTPVESHVKAMLLLALLAVSALPARPARANRNPLTCL